MNERDPRELPLDADLEASRAELERFFDGALPDEAARAVEVRLRADPSLRAEFDALGQVRAVLRAHVERQVAAADFSDFAARVAAGLKAEGGAPEVSAPQRRSSTSEPGVWERLRGWWGRHGTPVVVSAAAAAVVAFVVVRGSQPEVAPAPGIDEGVEIDAPVSVHSVRNEGRQTVLISSPADDDGGATVIWLLDQEQAEEGEADASVAGEDPI